MRRITRGTLIVVISLAWMCGVLSPVLSLALSPSASLGMNSVEGLPEGGLAIAQESGPTMQVAVGFDGYCRSGGWCPVYVVLSNEGTDVEGELRIAIRSASASSGPGVYARQVLLPAHSRKAYFLYLPSPNLPTGTHLTVRLFAGGGGDRVLLSEQAAVAWRGEGDRLYGVVSSNPSMLNFLSGVAPGSGKAEVAHLSLETLPPDPLGWEGLDVLILNDVDTAALSSEQRQALETWIAHGGHLIVGGGAGAARAVAGVASLLPVAVGGTRSVDDLWVLGDYLDVSTIAGPYAVAEATLRNGEALVEQGDLVLVARRTYGAGRVDFLAFDAGLNPFTLWDGNIRLWELIVEAGTVGAQRLTMYNGYSAHEAIKAIPGLDLPSTLQMLAFMLIYTLLVGPVNYIVLRKLDRRELAWLTIPALIVGFTVCAYVTGFQIRGGMAIVHRLAVVHVPALSPVPSPAEGKVEGLEGSTVGRVSQLVGLFSPRRTTYDVRVAGTGVREIPGDYYSGPAVRPLYVVEGAEGLTVDNLRVDVGGVQPFIVEGYADAPLVESDLRLVVDTAGVLRLVGTVRNDNMPLKEAVLIVGGDEQRLGNLEAGKEVSIHLQIHSGSGVITGPWPSVPSSGYNNPERILGPGDYWRSPVLRRRYQFLQALFPYEGPGLGSGVHLVGWVEEGVPLPVEVIGRPFSTVETALYVYDLPVVGLDTGVRVTIPPGLIERQVVETVGSVDMWPEGFHMEPEAEITIRFAVWPGMMVQQVDELVLDWQGSSYGNRSHPPTVSLWNEKSDSWEVLDVGWGQHSIPNAGTYVLSSGAVLMRLETGAEWPADVESLAITIKGQR